jgi:CRISPR-associated protein Csm3
MEKLFKKVFIECSLLCVTGLHIGDSKDNVDIGGLDGPVVRRKDNNEPYIPGSSLKGKMRCLLQQVIGELDFEMKKNSPICDLFGGTGSREKGNDGQPSYPAKVSKLIVRDAYLERASANELKNSKFTDMPYTEQKYENTIDRIKGTTIKGGVRNQERVPSGAIFDLHFVINVFAKDEKEAEQKEKAYLTLFKKGIELLNDDYLGGSGTRGYGQVKIEITKEETKTYAQTS